MMMAFARSPLVANARSSRSSGILAWAQRPGSENQHTRLVPELLGNVFLQAVLVAHRLEQACT
jgi:hypothetical protein